MRRLSDKTPQPLAALTAPALALHMGLILLVVSTALALLAFAIGQVLPAGETLLLMLPGRLTTGAYLFDLEHGLLHTIEDDATGQYVLNPADNHWMAYSAKRDGNWDIYRTNLFTGETHRLTDEPGFDGQPAWSADGKWVAFLSDRDSTMNLYAVDVSTGSAKTLTRGVVSRDNPAWSPDGQRLAFEARDSSGSVSLYVSRIACLTAREDCPRDVRPLTSSTRGDYFPTWSPDGRWVAFLSDRGGTGDVYIISTACLDSNTSCVQENARQLTHGIRATHALSWSADGGSLRFVADTNGAVTLYTVPMGCDLLPEGCIPQALLTIKR